MKKIENWWQSIDRLNFIFILSLGLTGIVLSFSVSEKFYLINRHSIFFIVGIVLLIYLSQLDDKNIRRISLLGFILSIFFIFIILFMDFEVKGAKRWIRIYTFTLQPSEIIKPFFIILSAWGISQSINGKKYYLSVSFILFLLLISGILLQPDLGMTMLISFTFFCQLFVAGLSIFLVIFGIVFLITIGLVSFFIFDHVRLRIISFLGGADTYQIDLSIKAFKSGGIFGKGPGQGDLKEKIPDANTDFIFAVAGEELGLIFCLVILIIILSIIIKTLINVLKTQDPYKMIAITGLICSFGLQSLINVFSSLGIIPTKGTTLPFVSYGGSSMIAISILFGFLLSLTNKNHE
ncbi:MAG: putative lipid II flippase FtsW [Alphaproteobacteria bacterium MarineAlpha5_Bin5]|nr:MAG: putative lipid II flippase FtsW [Alphaproteobacteria bacterium MarineAlpha5_Bin5]|tara:strand:+ start:867 stop:1916 length:1050 start_codon:yes stop_codon:yes gene_type:complete